MVKPYILFFDECSRKDIALLGGKGANLGELHSAGFPVPPGFGITSAAYDDFLDCHRLEPQVRQLVAEINFSDHDDVARSTEAIRKLIQSVEIPGFLVDAIRQAYCRLGANAPVAVRSSSAIPELGVSSFPGMMDTFFGIRGLENLLEHVKLCWTSLWTARAAANRWNKGIDHFRVRVSVLVQQMVPSEYSGVAFTANPVTLADELVIEAICGLGEALVSGRVTPDSFTVMKNSLQLRQGPGVSRIPSELVHEVAALACAIEKHYGKPQDIEWAYAQGKLYVLQSRDIRRREETPADYAGLERWNKPPQPGDEEVIWTRAWSDEVLTRAITPLFYSVQADLITATYDFMYRCCGLNDLLPMRLMRFHKNRGYFSTRYLLECLRYAPKFARSDDALKFFTPEQREEARSMPFLAWKKLKSEMRLSRRHKKYTLSRCHKTYYDEWLPELRRRIRDLDSLDLETASLDQLRDYYWGMDRLIKDHCQPIGFGVMVHTFAAVTFLGTALEKWLGDPSATSLLLSGLPGNNTVEFNEEVWKIAQKIRQSDYLAPLFLSALSADIPDALQRTEAGRAFSSELEDFRKTYDFRGAEDREISFPRWGDDHTLFLDVLKLFVAAGSGTEPRAGLQANIARREALTREIEQKLARQSLGRVKRAVFRFLLKYAQIYSLFRENQRFEVDRVFYGQRKAFLAIARRLVGRKLLSDLDDVWFLSKEEIFDVVAGRISAPEATRLITPRRAEYRKYLCSTPHMFLRDNQEFDVTSAAPASGEKGKILKGTAASSGQAVGTARVVHDLRELNRIKPGDILVTNSTDPGWTPAFLLIRGLVLETGGILAHGTVLSREYGIPAVTSVKNATTLIQEGETVAVDGTHGTVTIQEPSPTGKG